MTAIQLQSEQALLASAQSQHETIRALILERDKYRDALMKIARLQFQGLTYDERIDRANEIANTVLAEFE